MRKNIIFVLAILAAMFTFASAVMAGEEYVKETQLNNGVTAYQVGRTGLFGPTYRGVTLVGKPEPQPAILRLQSGSEEYKATTTTFSRCGQRNPDGSFPQTYFVGEVKSVDRKKGFQDAVNPANGQQPWTATTDAKGTGVIQDWGGKFLGNAPNLCPVNKININGTSNANTGSTTATGYGGEGGSAAASAAAAAAAAAAANGGGGNGGGKGCRR